MTAQPSGHEVLRFREVIAKRLGLDFDESKLGNLAKLLASRCQGDCNAYLDHLAAAPLEQLAALAPELTVTETYFFRYQDQITAFAEVALPERLQASEGLRPIRILSAGCASGDEPYSLAIAARERAGLTPSQVELSALDINPVMLAKAARAHYTHWSLREFPAELKQRWFRSEADGFVLSDAIRRMVRFENRNLVDSDPAFWRPESYDIIFCRNVLMYFTAQQMQAAVERITAALVPGGYLFLGHAETLRGLSSDFHLCHTHGTFYYRRKPELAASPSYLPPTVAAPQWHAGAALNDTSWIDAISRAAQRIHVLADGAPGTPQQAVYGAGGPDLERARAYLHSERYDRTLEQIGSLGSEHAGDPDVLLLKAVSLSQSGALAQAEAACRQLLALDELNAGAHYVLGLCREEGGDAHGAFGHYQSASYLDPEFAMARLHAGLLARRHGKRDAARHDLAQALLLLKREDPARLLLFGGGFKREALMALCRAELTALGESP
jgi:chemotaxis protein methyltransferase CheR